ncbi:MAG: glycosyltransferase [Streptococcaceae bacterium]|nr:glycosyltransferase [Streptococcaceae bacterium]
MEVIQNFIFPSEKTLASKEMFFRFEEGIKEQNNELLLSQDAQVKFDTYYNALSAAFWKKKVGISSVELLISGAGVINVELCMLDSNDCETVLEKRELTLTEECQTIFRVSFEGLDNVLLYPKITSSAVHSTITGMSWITNQSKRRKVKLGISITHFDRKAYVIPAIKRIKEALLDNPEWQEKIDLVVVDNSKNITSEESLGVKIIPNENTGGSGGFMRGLLHYKNETDVTHVLFMDDDASLEIESVKRTYQILSFAEKGNTSVGASLFYESEPDKLIERGAYFDKKFVWMANYRDVSPINAKEILFEETKEERIDYAGWWFFAFPIAFAQKMTLPFFVRGDDVSFGFLNDFNILLTNGIACYAEDFDTKMSPMVSYVNSRNKMIVDFLMNRSLWSVLQFHLGVNLSMLLAMRMGYVNIGRKAFQDFLNLSAEWMIEHANLSAMFSQLNELAVINLPRETDLSSYSKREEAENKFEISLEETRAVLIKSYFKALFLAKKKALFVSENRYTVDTERIVGYQNVFYGTIAGENATGYVAKFSRLRLLKYSFILIGDAVRLVFRYRKLRQFFEAHINDLTSEAAWRKILGLD